MFKKILASFIALIIAVSLVTVVPSENAVRADADPVVTFVTSLYADCLGRNPDPAGLNDWVNRLRTHQISGKQAAYGFFFSNEFIARQNQLSDGDLVDTFYRVFLNRTADQGGKDYWIGKISTTSYDITTLFTGFADSAEFAQKCANYGIDAGAHVNVPNVVRGGNAISVAQWNANTSSFYYAYDVYDGSGYSQGDSNVYYTWERTFEYTVKVLNGSLLNNYTVHYDVYYSSTGSMNNARLVYSNNILPKAYNDGSFYEFQYTDPDGSLDAGYYFIVGSRDGVTYFNQSVEVLP